LPDRKWHQRDAEAAITSASSSSNKRPKLTHTPNTNATKPYQQIGRPPTSSSSSSKPDAFTTMLLEDNLITSTTGDQYMSQDERTVRELEQKLGIRTGAASEAKSSEYAKQMRKLQREMTDDGLDELLTLCDEYEEKGLIGFETQFHMNKSAGQHQGQEEDDDDEESDSESDASEDGSADGDDNEVDDPAAESGDGIDDVDAVSSDDEEAQLLARLAEVRQRKKLKQQSANKQQHADEQPSSDVDDDADSDASISGVEDSNSDQSSEEELVDDGDEQLIEQKHEPKRAKPTYDEIYGFNAPAPASLLTYQEEQKSVVDDAAVPASRSSNKYVPPHLRSQLSGTTTTAATTSNPQLHKSIQGLLNRLSDSNIEPIVNQLAVLYKEHSRREVNDVLCDLIITNISNEQQVLQQLVLTYSALISTLHLLYNDSTAVGAMFVETIILRWYKLYTHSHSKLTDNDKAISNLLLLVVYLYNFDVLSTAMMYDLLKLVMHVGDPCSDSKDATPQAPLTTLDVELILLILQSCGYQLRKHDAQALKEVILLIQRSVQASKQQSSSTLDDTRVQYMLDTIYQIKNNKKQQHSAYEVIQPVKTHVLVLARKQLKSSSKVINVQANDASERQVMFTLQDLLNIPKNGRWWLTGAAFHRKQFNDATNQPANATDDAPAMPPVDSDTTTSKLQTLATTHRMTTEIRQAIFYVIMSSDDYLDAYEKLNKLKHTPQQQQEIIRIIIECVTSERNYNPYYALLCHRLLLDDRRHRLTLQFCVWDLLQQYGNAREWKNTVDNNRRVVNLATFVASLIASAYNTAQEQPTSRKQQKEQAPHTTLHIIKPLPLTNLSLAQLLFVHTLITQIVKQTTDTATLQQIAQKLTTKEEYRTVKDGLLYTIKKHVVKSVDRELRPRVKVMCEVLLEDIVEQNTATVDEVTSDEILV